MKLQSKEMGDSQVPKDTWGQITKVNDIIKGLADAISKRLAGGSPSRGGGELPCSMASGRLLSLCICNSTALAWQIHSSTTLVLFVT